MQGPSERRSVARKDARTALAGDPPSASVDGLRRRARNSLQAHFAANRKRSGRNSAPCLFVPRYITRH